MYVPKIMPGQNLRGIAYAASNDHGQAVVNPKIQELIKLLKTARGLASGILARMALTSPEDRPVIISALIEALKDEDDNVRHGAAMALGIGSAAKDAVPALTVALRDKHPWVREAAATALFDIGPEAPEAKESVPVLTELVLKDENEDVRRQATIALGGIRLATEEVITTLTRALKDSYYGVRMCAASSLGKLAPAAKAAVPVLIETLKDVNSIARGWAAETLGKIGPAAKAAVQPLTEALKDRSQRNWLVLREASGALAEITKC